MHVLLRELVEEAHRFASVRVLGCQLVASGIRRRILLSKGSVHALLLGCLRRVDGLPGGDAVVERVDVRRLEADLDADVVTYPCSSIIHEFGVVFKI